MAYQKLQASRAAAVVPNDTTDIPNPANASGLGNNGNVLYVGAAGNLRVMTVAGDDVTFSNVQVGTFLPIQVVRVFATGTTADDIIALW
jgi:hypothetical protein|tara:strand:+ start:5228 stop:5494 length:267 start_codon:yes stop_codon:yes gene_type:complete